MLRSSSANATKFLSRIVTDEETWVHHYQPQIKRQCKKWKHPSFPICKKFKQRPPCKKPDANVLLGYEGAYSDDLPDTWRNYEQFNVSCFAARPSEIPIHHKRQKLLSKWVLPLYDNGRPHTATATVETVP